MTKIADAISSLPAQITECAKLAYILTDTANSNSPRLLTALKQKQIVRGNEENTKTRPEFACEEFATPRLLWEYSRDLGIYDWESVEISDGRMTNRRHFKPIFRKRIPGELFSPAWEIVVNHNHPRFSQEQLDSMAVWTWSIFFSDRFVQAINAGGSPIGNMPPETRRLNATIYRDPDHRWKRNSYQVYLQPQLLVP